jgi:predicted CXXCH cytochrome family protein
MIILKRIIEYSIFCTAILLAFLLVFEKYLILPTFVQWIGHWHPLILHFPIVLILVTILQHWRKDEHFEWYLGITSLLTFLTAITGFLLSLEGDAKGNLILAHQWQGIGTAYLMGIWYWLDQWKPVRAFFPVLLQGVLIVLIVITGHFGGMVTHGKDFLTFGFKDKTDRQRLPDNPIIYAHIIQPILNEKCVSCHNPNKSKGKLVLTDYASILKGGESGQAVDPQNSANSLVLSRILLPPEDDEHMPPRDEKQLTDNEMILLSEWIEQGADEHLTFDDLEEGGESYMLVSKTIERGRSNKWNGLPGISDDKLKELSSDYVRISRLFNMSNALQVIVYPHKDYKNADIRALKPLNKNIVELNLSGLPISEWELEFTASCLNIERLNISNTPIDDQGISTLNGLKKLRELKIYNTPLTDQALQVFNEWPDLSKLFLFNTRITDEGLNRFLERKGDVYAVKTVEEVNGFQSVLPSPTLDPIKYFFRESFKIKLAHPLNGINIFYTTNGSTPDETSEKAPDSLLIHKNIKLKFFAAKEGWVSSPQDSMQFFKSITEPDRYVLQNPPHPNFTGRGEKLLFDLDKGIEVFGDSAWMAFREDDCILNCEWDEEVRLSTVVLSSIVHTDPYLFPPESIIVKGGMEKSNMRVLASIIPEKLEERAERYFNFYECQFDPVNVRYVEILVQPLQKIPMWHRGKGEKGWFFIDEVVFQAD